jgi:hypothetical protein
MCVCVCVYKLLFLTYTCNALVRQTRAQDVHTSQGREHILTALFDGRVRAFSKCMHVLGTVRVSCEIDVQVKTKQMYACVSYKNMRKHGRFRTRWDSKLPVIRSPPCAMDPGWIDLYIH